jgi:hypothetical protein
MRPHGTSGQAMIARQSRAARLALMNEDNSGVVLDTNLTGTYRWISAQSAA